MSECEREFNRGHNDPTYKGIVPVARLATKKRWPAIA